MATRLTRTLNWDEKERIMQIVADVLATRPEIVFAYVHGSFLSEGPFHDCDIAVFLAPDAVAPDRLRGYECELAEAIEDGINVPADVRVLNDAPLSFRYHVLKGQLLMARDREILDTFRERTWDAYLDFAPFAQQYLREVLDE